MKTLIIKLSLIIMSLVFVSYLSSLAQDYDDVYYNPNNKSEKKIREHRKKTVTRRVKNTKYNKSESDFLSAKKAYKRILSSSDSVRPIKKVIVYDDDDATRAYSTPGLRINNRVNGSLSIETKGNTNIYINDYSDYSLWRPSLSTRMYKRDSWEPYFYLGFGLLDAVFNNASCYYNTYWTDPYWDYGYYYGYRNYMPYYYRPHIWNNRYCWWDYDYYRTPYCGSPIYARSVYYGKRPISNVGRVGSYSRRDVVDNRRYRTSSYSGSSISPSSYRRSTTRSSSPARSSYRRSTTRSSSPARSSYRRSTTRSSSPARSSYRRSTTRSSSPARSSYRRSTTRSSSPARSSYRRSTTRSSSPARSSYRRSTARSSSPARSSYRRSTTRSSSPASSSYRRSTTRSSSPARSSYRRSSSSSSRSSSTRYRTSRRSRR